MAEKITVQAMTYIGAEVATKKVDELGIKFNAHQRRIMIATLASNFVGGAATALKMLKDGHDLSDVEQLAAQVDATIKQGLQ